MERKRPAKAEGWIAPKGRGPFYLLEDAARLMQREPIEVSKAASAGEVLMVTTSDDVQLVPAWQFRGREVDPQMAKVLATFHKVPVDRWMVVQWATAPDPQLGGMSAVEAVQAGHDVQAVLSDALRYAWKWSQ